IKSMSRKTASFSQLINYINKGREKDDEYCFKHNIYASKPYTITKEFLENHKTLKKRKNTNSLFHEVISIKYQKSYSKEQLREILKDLTEQYIKARANNCLVYSVIHEQHNQIHAHLMISSNELDSTKTHYFSKHQYKQIQELTRKYAYEKYPQLEREETKEKLKEQSKQSSKRKSKIVDSEVHLKKRTGKDSEREKLRERLKTIFKLAKSQDEFIKFLRMEKLELYQRGQTFGFLDQETGKKYRLKTLELENEFQNMNDSFLERQNDKSKQAQYEKQKENENSQDKSKSQDFSR
ncbi:relaxase/mobilization nuclease domain-containing protein, partial [Desulfovibrio sp. OttesenSCG-928-G11]|nr:relaxase/mobilization nuclease domain-containing protein [Desulfovibrio sp. OttesenSCG-928-G11]